MKRDLIILGIGLTIGYFLFRSRVVSGGIKVTRPGDKGKEIEGVQKLFEKVTKLQFSDYGVYDQQTLDSVNYLLKGTSALKNDKGTIDKTFMNDLSTIYFNSLTI